MFCLGLGRISGRIPDIEIIRPVIQYSPDIQPYFTEVIRPDIRQFSLLYQTKLNLSGLTGYIRPNPIFVFISFGDEVFPCSSKIDKINIKITSLLVYIIYRDREK